MKKSLVMAMALWMTGTAVYAASVPSSHGGERKYAPQEDLEEINKDVVPVYSRKEAAAPMKLNADQAEYNEETGAFFAKGNVEMFHNGQIMRTEYAEGNMKTGDIYMQQGGDLIEGNTALHAEWVHYNFLSREGKIEKISGSNYSKQEWYRSPNAEVKDGKVLCGDGAVISKCPAIEHVSCLSVECKSLEVIPHDKMIARDCWVKIRGKKIYHRDRWINDLTTKRQSKIMPRIGWDDDHGMEYKLEIEQPLWKGATAGADIVYYGQDHYKPNFWLDQDTKDFNVSLSNGWDDDEGDWYKKQMNWEFNWKRHRILKDLPLSYSAFVEHGLWQKKDEGGHYSKRSWHTEYGAYLYHDPIHFFNSQKNSLNLYVGRKWTKESLTGETIGTNTYGATLTQKFNEQLKCWIGYYDEKATSNLFDLNNADMQKEVRPGIQYTFPNKKDILSAVYRLDVKKGRRYEYDLTWLHHFCCWDLEFTYEREFVDRDHSFSVKYNFNFM